MTYQRVLSGIGVTALVAGTLVLGTGPAFAAETTAPPVVVPVSTQVTPPTSYPYQPVLKTVPDDPNDASLFRGLIPYDEIAPKINSLVALGDRVSAQVVGQSALGKDIFLVTVTAPETTEQTAQQAVWRDKVKHNAAAAATDDALAAGYKVPIWFNGNIHGNEWEGTDATLAYIEKLATSPYSEVKDLLEKNRLYFTVTNNPDGRALGQRPSGSGFDINRDMITGATPESTIIRDLSAVIQPTFFIDLHGYTNVLQIEPCGPPHGENYEYDLFLPHAYEAALAMEKAVVDANIPGNTYQAANGGATTVNTGKVMIPYRDIRSGWDDWPPIFTPQYVAYQGAITNTVELPLGRSTNSATSLANAKVDVAVAGVVIDTAVQYVEDNSAALLDNQMEIFRRGDAGEPLKVTPADIDPATVPEPNEWADIWDETDVYTAEFPRAYVIPTGGTQRSDTDARALVDQLIANGVEVAKTEEPLTVEGVTYAKGSYFVDMHQPLRGMANVLLADGSDISTRVPDMYDISAWSLGLLWGAKVDAIGSTEDPAVAVATKPVTVASSQGTLPVKGSYLELDTSGVADYQAINALVEADVPVSVFEDGTVILGPDDESYDAARDVVDAYGVQFTASTGERLFTEESKGLADLTIGYTGTQDDRVSLTKLGFKNLVLMTSATINSGVVDLTKVDALWIGSALTFSGAQTAGRAAVTSFIASGKGVAGKSTAISTFATTFGLTTATAVSGTSGSNGIVSVDTAEDGLLAHHSQDTAFVYPAVWYNALGSNAKVEQSYATEDTLISGHWADSTGRSRTDAAGKAAVVSATGPSGSKLVMFGISPNYRAHTIGSFNQIARSLFWVGAEGAEVPTPTIGAVKPTITGTVQVGFTVTAEAGDWTPSSIDLAYQWLRDGEPILGAVKPEYDVTSDDFEHVLSVTVTGSRENYETVSLTSAETAPVEGAALTPFKPSISGKGTVGATLTAHAPAWGPVPVALSYQWLSDGEDIAGATALTYKVAAADAGKLITFELTGSKAGYKTSSKVSAPIAIGNVFTATPTPKISGTVKVGKKLTAKAGTWGPAPVTLKYQWKLNGKSITGATKSTYTLKKAQKGKSITVTVTGSKSGYTSVAKTSSAKKIK